MTERYAFMMSIPGVGEFEVTELPKRLPHDVEIQFEGMLEFLGRNKDEFDTVWALTHLTPEQLEVGMKKTLMKIKTKRELLPLVEVATLKVAPELMQKPAILQNWRHEVDGYIKEKMKLGEVVG